MKKYIFKSKENWKCCMVSSTAMSNNNISSSRHSQHDTTGKPSSQLGQNTLLSSRLLHCTKLKLISVALLFVSRPSIKSKPNTLHNYINKMILSINLFLMLMWWSFHKGDVSKGEGGGAYYHLGLALAFIWKFHVANYDRIQPPVIRMGHLCSI
jgi:hypothetical protein